MNTNETHRASINSPDGRYICRAENARHVLAEIVSDIRWYIANRRKVSARSALSAAATLQAAMRERGMRAISPAGMRRIYGQFVRAGM